MHTQHLLRRKRSILQAYAILLWLILVQVASICASWGLALFLWPCRVFYKLLTLQYAYNFVLGIFGLFHSDTRPRQAVVVFTRFPTVGRTKSRLIPYIGHNNAAMVMRVLTENIVRRLYPLGERKEADLFLAYKDGCHVICEASMCNKPVNFWMEKISNHPDFRNRSCSNHSNNNHKEESNGIHLRASAASESAPNLLTHQHRDFRRQFTTESPVDKVRMDDAMAVGKFDCYLPQLRSSIEYESRLMTPEEKCLCRTRACKGPDKVVQPLPQSGNSIGATLESVLWTLFMNGYDRVVLVSSDVPGVQELHIHQALRSMDLGARLVLGKTQSGGFYLLAAKRSISRHISQLFRNILWGTSGVFDSQMSNAERLGVPAAALCAVLRDCDCVEDLGILETELGIPSGLFLRETVSVLMPARNEADHIETTLRNMLFNCSRRRKLQIVVVDGRSVDGTAQVVEEFMSRRAHTYLSKTDLRGVSMEVHTLPKHIPSGRGNMIRYGMNYVTGSYYLVLHADSSPPENWDDVIVQGLSKPGVVAGAFTFHLKIPNELCFSKNIPWALRTMLLEFYTNYRCRRYELPSGSQGLFMHAYYYHLLGGYKDWPFLEDVEFVERLQRHGHLCIADAAVMTSPRRWVTHGFVSACAMNAAVLLAYRLKVDPEKLGRLYYSVGKSYVKM